jgi:hypothetical protein
MMQKNGRPAGAPLRIQYGEVVEDRQAGKENLTSNM